MQMIFKETELKGAYVIEPEQIADNRGFFCPGLVWAGI